MPHEMTGELPSWRLGSGSASIVQTVYNRWASGHAPRLDFEKALYDLFDAANARGAAEHTCSIGHVVQYELRIRRQGELGLEP